jgi:FkbM family methyltransferase
MDKSKFDWGKSNEWFRTTINMEIFENKIYERFFQVEEGDVVFDFGASVGPFTYSIIDTKPKHVFCIEPSFQEFKTLIKNTKKYSVTCINKAIMDENKEYRIGAVYDSEDNSGIVQGITFKQLIDDYNISKIDFIKTDCEGGEYSIFNVDNLIWIKNNVKKISGEFHLGHPELKAKFREFRDVYLRVFKNFEIFSYDMVDIKWDLWNEHFIEYYSEIIVYIDNR